MNTLFVILVGTLFYYLFFYPLDMNEWMEAKLDTIYLEYVEDNHEKGVS